MRALAGWIVANPAQAVLAIVASTVLGVLAPPFSSLLIYAGGAALALYSLHTGVRRGALVMLAALAVVGALSVLAGGRIAPTLMLSWYWVPVWLAAGVLRHWVSLGAALLTLTGIGLLSVLLGYAWLGDPAAWWLERLQPLVQALAGQPELGLGREQLAQLAAQTAQLLTGLVAAGLVLAALVSLLLGRWWQSLLVHPGGLREEFYALALGKGVTLAGVLLLVSASLDLGPFSNMLLQLALVVLVPFTLVGLAVIHATLARLKAGKGWLIAAYVLIGLLPQALLIVAVTGMLDPWLDLRRRSRKPG